VTTALTDGTCAGLESADDQGRFIEVDEARPALRYLHDRYAAAIVECNDPVCWIRGLDVVKQGRF
jgi:hypothetical protein